MGQPTFLSGSTYVHRVLVTDKATGQDIPVADLSAVFTAVSCVDDIVITKTTVAGEGIIKPTEVPNALDIVINPADTSGFTGNRTLDTQIDITEQGGRVSKVKLTNFNVERG